MPFLEEGEGAISLPYSTILFSCNAWDDYKVRYKDSIRSVEIENVKRQQTNGQTKFIINF